MGKYMKKSNIIGDVAVMEVSTRVLAGPKTLPLEPDDTSSLCYLQLRNRRLHKPSPPSKQPQSRGKFLKPQNLSSNTASTSSSNSKPNSSLRLNSIRSGSVKSVPHGCDGRDVQVSFDDNEMRQNDFNDVGTEEASFGENKLELEPRDRSIRESTPCSLIRASDAMGTPRSNTRRIRSTYRGGRNDDQRIMPTPCEMEEFFAYAEQQQRRIFMEKYNFDTLNDLPPPGRYEWVQAFA